MSFKYSGVKVRTLISHRHTRTHMDFLSPPHYPALQRDHSRRRDRREIPIVLLVCNDCLKARVAGDPNALHWDLWKYLMKK